MHVSHTFAEAEPVVLRS